MIRSILLVNFMILGAVTASPVFAEGSKPNLVYILVDDLGYGDVSCLNPTGKIPTPHIDRLATEGMIFTDAHSSSSVCTPTRYNVLTGRYSWRTTLKQGVLNGYGPPLIAEDRLTLASLCRDHGYVTAMIGKWHLGMEIPVRGHSMVERQVNSKRTKKVRVYDIDWTAKVGRTPTSNGFDYFWGHGASLDFPPYNYIENEHYTTHTTVFFPDEVDYKVTSMMRAGNIGDNFDPYQTLDEFCDRSAAYIRAHDKTKPFFLYIPLTSPHTPIIPTDAWKGKNELGPYGDFVMQTDAAVGRVLDALDETGQADNTIVIFTSDNGCSRAAGIPQMASKGHLTNGIYRGSKADLWEGGHRVAHLLRWPSQVQPGRSSDRLTVLGDIVATMADIIGADVPANAAEDSVSFYPAMRGESDPSKEHRAIIHHSVSGEFAVRTKGWKLQFTPGSGGWTAPRDADARKQGLPKYQLYNMSEDPSETTNLYESNPEMVSALTAIATEIVVNGRSSPGEPQPNDTPNDWKQLHWMAK